MRIRLLTAWIDQEAGRQFRLGEICHVPEDLPEKMARRLLADGHAASLPDVPETAMLGGDRDNAMLPAGRARNSKRR